MKMQIKGILLSAALAGFMLPAMAQKSEVGKRAENQQDRIAQGVKSGQLTPHETTHLERREGAVHREVRRDRKANGGKLTPAERARVNRQQNKTSRQIYRDKHNRRVQ